MRGAIVNRTLQALPTSRILAAHGTARPARCIFNSPLISLSKPVNSSFTTTVVRQGSGRASLSPFTPLKIAPTAIKGTTAFAGRTLSLAGRNPAIMSVRTKSTSSSKLVYSTHERFSLHWWKDNIIIMLVFAITGSSSLYIVRPTLKEVMGLEGRQRRIHI